MGGNTDFEKLQQLKETSDRDDIVVDLMVTVAKLEERIKILEDGGTS